MTYPSTKAFREWWDAVVTYNAEGRRAYDRAQKAEDKLYAEAAAPPVPTKSVRIAVAINQFGDWDAVGFAALGGDIALSNLVRERLQDESAHVVYVTADIPLPQVTEVEGMVEG